MDASPPDEADVLHSTLPLQAPHAAGGRSRTLHRAGLDGPTPVFGTAQPPHGASGGIRRAAYGIPEHRARHWMLLLLADRVDVAEDRLGAALARPVRSIGAPRAAERVGESPWMALGIAAAALWAVRRVFR